MSDLPEVFERLSPERRELLELLLLEEARRLTREEARPASGDRVEGRDAGTREGPLSHAQQRLWLLDRLEPGSALLNTATAVRLSGPLDLAVLARSLAELVRRHEVLRTTYEEGPDGPLQKVGPPFTPPLPVVDLSRVPVEPVGSDPVLSAVVAAETARPFDLGEGPVLRLAAARLSERDHVLVVTAHHIASDAWSMGVFGRELATVYRAFAVGAPSPLVELPLQYLDHAREERRSGDSGELEDHLEYWRGRLAGAPELLDLAPNRPRPSRRRFRGATRNRRLPRELSETAREAFRERDVSLFMGLLAVFEVLLHQRSGRTDLVVGMDVADRDRPGTESLIGLFLEQVVLRVDLGGDPSFEEVLERVRGRMVEAWEHRNVPFDRLVEELRPTRRLDRNPLFQVMFGLYNAPVSAAEPGEVGMRPLEMAGHSAMFDLSLYFAETDEGLLAMARYDTDLFGASAVDGLLEDYELLLGHALTEPSTPVSELRERIDAARRGRLGAARERLRRAGARTLKTVRRRSAARRPAPREDDSEKGEP